MCMNIFRVQYSVLRTPQWSYSVTSTRTHTTRYVIHVLYEIKRESRILLPVTVLVYFLFLPTPDSIYAYTVKNRQNHKRPTKMFFLVINLGGIALNGVFSFGTGSQLARLLHPSSWLSLSLTWQRNHAVVIHSQYCPTHKATSRLLSWTPNCQGFQTVFWFLKWSHHQSTQHCPIFSLHRYLYTVTIPSFKSTYNESLVQHQRSYSRHVINRRGFHVLIPTFVIIFCVRRS